ncbi:MAG TPA: aspartyl protease family protein [Terracidiphilus sp.]|nr:aspartyl protease family protein [Terracidiphilus sp.]
MSANSDPPRSPVESVNVEMKMIPARGHAYRLVVTGIRRMTIYLKRKLPVAGMSFAFALVVFVSPLAAQQGATPTPQAAQQSPTPTAPQSPPPTASLAAPQETPKPEPESPVPVAQPSSPRAQQPGVGTQLQTGTSSGLTLDARIENLLADHQYSRVAAQLDQLPPQEAQLYRGVLANRANDLKQSVQLLEPLVDQVTASGDTAHEKLLRTALAEDYLRMGDWSKAAKAYQALDARLHAKLSTDEQDEIEMPLKMLPLAKDNPPTTIDPCDPFSLQVTTNPLGLVDIPVFVDARSRSWMLDPTLPFNLIARSTAKDVGLKLSFETATIHTLTGRPIQVRVTVVPRFTIGGRLTLHNMTAFVYEDADYAFPRSGYRVEGVLGYPALAAIGSLTITSDATIQVRPAKQIGTPAKDDLLTDGAPFYLDGDQVIVALRRVQALADPGPSPDAAGSGSPSGPPAGPNDERMYAIDAGGQQTYLTSRYFDEHAAEFNSMKVDLYAPPGQESGSQPSYIAESVPLSVGNATVELHYIRVLTQPLGSAALDDVYGILGVDALGQLKSYTFDYRTMRFKAVGE